MKPPGAWDVVVGIAGDPIRNPRGQVGIGLDHDTKSLFIYSACCVAKYSAVYASSPVPSRGPLAVWACSNCYVELGSHLSLLPVHTPVDQPTNILREWVSRWVGLSMHDIELTVEWEVD